MVIGDWTFEAASMAAGKESYLFENYSDPPKKTNGWLAGPREKLVGVSWVR